jgi:HK97 gp10 family phage protein
MSKTRVQLDADAIAKLQALGDKYVADVVLPKVEASAKRIVPVDSGDLHDSIHTEVTSEGMFVVADEEYASHVELGTSKMAAQPYLRPALYSLKD